jgi:hypothetical protein
METEHSGGQGLKLAVMPRRRRKLGFSLGKECNGKTITGGMEIQGGSNMTGTNCDLFTHK